MYNQLKIEFYKLRKFSIFYIVVLIVSVAGFSYGYFRCRFALNTHIVFSSVISNPSFLFLQAVVSSLFIGSDFGNRTITHEIKLGCSRLSVILARLIPVSISSMLIHILYVVFTVLGYSVDFGFDTSVFNGENLVWLITVLLQLIAIQSFVVMICFITKKMEMAMGLSLISIVVLCNILINFIEADKRFAILCFGLAELDSVAWLVVCASVAIISTVVFVLGAVLSFYKADIK